VPDYPLPCAAVQAKLVMELSYSLIDIDKANAEAFAPFSISALVDFLKRSHRFYLLKVLPEIDQLIDQLHLHHPDERIINAMLRPSFQLFCSELRAHILWEEQGLFPYAIGLEKGKDHLLNDAKSNTEQLGVFLLHHPDHEHEIEHIIRALEILQRKYPDSMLCRVIEHRVSLLRDDLKLHGIVEDEALVGKLRDTNARLSN
jgi:regulator of cell morphogenesis and NO signaling